MLDPEVLIEVIRRALSRGGEYADVFVEQRESTAIVLEENRLEKAVVGVSSGVGIRLVVDGRTAYAFCNVLTRDALLEAASNLSRTAAGGKEGIAIDLTAAAPGLVQEVKLPPGSVPVEKKVELVHAANVAARGAGKEVTQVVVAYRDSVQKVRIATSGGVLADDERVHTLGMVQAVAERGGVVQTGYEPVAGLSGFELFESSPLEEAALRAARRAVRTLSARRAPGGRMPVVISSEAGGTMIHEAIGHGLEADLAGRGLSRFSGMKGRQVASPLVTVVDDATLPGRRGSFGFDDEGAPSRRTELVRDGLLVGFLYDRLTAMRDGVSPTGNGRRESYQYRPIPRMTNTFIAPGGTSPAEVLRSTPKGLLVRKMGGGQVNTVSGDFVFDVSEGYLIENGAQGEPVRGATLTGNGPEVLLSIDMVASDLGFSIGTCGKDGQGVPISDAQPTIRIPEMVVGGES